VRGISAPEGIRDSWVSKSVAQDHRLLSHHPPSQEPPLLLDLQTQRAGLESTPHLGIGKDGARTGGCTLFFLRGCLLLEEDDTDPKHKGRPHPLGWPKRAPEPQKGTAAGGGPDRMTDFHPTPLALMRHGDWKREGGTRFDKQTGASCCTDSLHAFEIL